MAPFLPIRAFNRSQNIRIGKQKVIATANTYVDLGDAATRKEYTYHSAIGATYPVGPLLTAAPANDGAVVTGGVVSAGAGLTANVTAGEQKNLGTGAVTPGLAGTNVTIGANATGNPRIDLVVWDQAAGTAQVVGGTAAVAPVAPAVPAGKTLLASVAVPNGAAAPGTITDLRVRP